MNLLDCRTKYLSGQLEKQSYIDAMHHLHERLFEYSQLIEQTDIQEIIIKDGCVVMTLRSTGMKLLSESLDKRAAPIETLNFGYYEKNDADMIFQLLDADMTLFDIGANVGWYAINIALKDKTIKVHAFEPISPTFELLKKNIALNNLENIHLYNFGFSDENKAIIFYVDPNTTVSASARNMHDSPDIVQSIAQVKKLDDFFTATVASRLDFIKCDVEGAELLVYKGGLETIKNNLPIIFTEMLRKWSAKFGYHPNDIIDLLGGTGYQCFTADTGKLIPFEQMDENTKETNFFFLHTTKHAAKIALFS